MVITSHTSSKVEASHSEVEVQDCAYSDSYDIKVLCSEDAKSADIRLTVTSSNSNHSLGTRLRGPQSAIRIHTKALVPAVSFGESLMSYPASRVLLAVLILLC